LKPCVFNLVKTRVFSLYKFMVKSDSNDLKAANSGLITVRNLGFRRAKRWIFRDLNFTIQQGEFIALVGPSGAGKTTLLSCLCGLLKADEGEIWVRPDLLSKPQAPVDYRCHFGIIFQNLNLISNADLLTNVQCGRLGRYGFLRTLLGLPKKERIEAYDLLSDLGVGADPYKWVSEMSGGEQQRVAIARALFQSPSLYFADEPVSNLDTYYAGRVLGLLRQQASQLGRSVVCVLHDPALINRWADRTIALHPDDPNAWRIREVRPPASELKGANL
jgi:phosphonate transport system ATP-binding protein